MPPRREIAVGERLLLISRAGSYESVVAADGRLTLPNGEHIPAVRRTLAEFLIALPGRTAVRRIPDPNVFPILSSGVVLRVANGTSLLDALRGLSSVETVTVIAADDTTVTVGRAAFGTRRLVPGDALVLGKEIAIARASIIGGVARPGVVELKTDTTLADAVRLAGGLTPRALDGQILVERERKALGPFHLTTDGTTPLRAGDVVRVPVSESVSYLSVAGAVRHPGLIEVTPGMTVANAIDAAGGLTLPAEGLFVVLRSVTDPRRKPIKAKATELGRFPVLKSGDVLEIAPPPARPQ